MPFGLVTNYAGEERHSLEGPRSLALANLVPEVDHELLLLFVESAAPVLAGPDHSLQSRDIESPRLL